MEYQSNNSNSAAITASNGTASSIASNTASGSENRKPATAQQLVRENVQYLIEQLEAGHSETLTAFLDAMAHFQKLFFWQCLAHSETKARSHKCSGNVDMEPAWAQGQAGRKRHRHSCADGWQEPQEARESERRC